MHDMKAGDEVTWIIARVARRSSIGSMVFGPFGLAHLGGGGARRRYRGGVS